MALGNHIGLPFGRRKGVPKPPVTEVTWNPNVTSNVSPTDTQFYNSDGSLLEAGTVLSVGAKIYVKVTFEDGADVELHGVTINGTVLTLESTPTGDMYAWTVDVLSPQQVKVNASEYIRFEDIKQPYPEIIHLKQDGLPISWGDKLKVGSEIIFVEKTNLFPDLYTVGGGIRYNGTTIYGNTTIVVEKSMVFTNVHTYKKENEPNCILSNQILPIPNESYKYMGYQPDLSGHGNHGVFNNFMFAKDSGVNGYVEDFNTWIKYPGVLSTDSKITLDKTHSSQWISYVPSNIVVPTFKVMISGIPTGGSLRIFSGSINIVLTNGENTIQGFTANGATGFFIFSGVNLDWSNLVIQQIGEYEGSICFNGTNNFMTIPTLEHGAKQVLMKVNLQNYDRYLYDQRNNWSQWLAIVSAGNTLAYQYSNQGGKTYIDGILNEHIIDKDLLNITHNITVTNANTGKQYSPNIGTSFARGTFAQMALFTFMSFDDISSEDEIKELNDIVGIEGGYVESPDYYFDSFGKSNVLADDIDNGIKNINDSRIFLFDKSITGLAAIEQTNIDGAVGRIIDRALQAYNFAFNEASGYGGQKLIFPFTKPYTGGWNYAEDRVSFEPLDNGNSVRITEVKSGAALFWIGKITGTAYYKVTGVSTGKGIKFGSDAGSAIWSKVVEEDGIYEIDWSLNVDSSGTILSTCILSSGFRGECDIVIEQVSQYQNGLLFNGSNNYFTNSVIPAVTDFTVIGKRTVLDTPVNSAFCCKGEDYYTRAAFMLEFRGGSNEQVASFGVTSNVNLPDLITFMTATSYNGVTIGKGTSTDKAGLWIGRYNTATFWKGVFYKLMFYSKTIDVLSINMLKNLFAQDILIDVKNPIFKKS